ncbi:MAG: hypothetical protein ACNA8L_02900 [Luteolibacter sp.]
MHHRSTRTGITSLEIMLLSVVIMFVAALVISYYFEGNPALKERPGIIIISLEK